MTTLGPYYVPTRDELADTTDAALVAELVSAAVVHPKLDNAERLEAFRREVLRRLREGRVARAKLGFPQRPKNPEQEEARKL